MRIISGEFKSRLLKMVPSKDTRETSDKVRGAVFNSLGESIRDAVILDLFAGSGSYGLESISRGAKYVVFNDVKQIAINTLNENIANLGVNDRVILWKHDYNIALKKLSELKDKLDIVFLDPPYKLDIYESISNQLIPHLNEDALLVLEMDKNRILDLEQIKAYTVMKEKVYGSKKILILSKH